MICEAVEAPVESWVVEDECEWVELGRPQMQGAGDLQTLAHPLALH